MLAKEKKKWGEKEGGTNSLLAKFSFVFSHKVLFMTKEGKKFVDNKQTLK